MTKTRLLNYLALASLAIPAFGVTLSQRANIVGGGNGEFGKCTIEVDVDGAADLDVFSSQGSLKTLSGQTAIWRRFECSSPMPGNMSDFRFQGVDGRGNVNLIRDPRSNGGHAVVRINDPKGGREGYTFDLEWRTGGQGGWPGPGGQGGVRVAIPVPGGGDDRRFDGPGDRRDGDDRDRRDRDDRDRGPRGREGAGMAQAVRVCQNSVEQRLNQQGIRYISFEQIVPDNSPERNDWVRGTLVAQRGRRSDRYSFACSVDFGSGSVRTVEVNRNR
jgi:hypothetical protein